MRAAVIHAFGGPEVLQIEERPEPVLRETDVLVEVHATSVNPVDAKVRASSSAPRALVDAGLLRPRVSQRVPLEQLASAHRQIESRRTVGKVAVLVRPRV